MSGPPPDTRTPSKSGIFLQTSRKHKPQHLNCHKLVSLIALSTDKHSLAVFPIYLSRFSSTTNSLFFVVAQPYDSPTVLGPVRSSENSYSLTELNGAIVKIDHPAFPKKISVLLNSHHITFARPSPQSDFSQVPDLSSHPLYPLFRNDRNIDNVPQATFFTVELRPEQQKTKKHSRSSLKSDSSSC